MLPPLSPFRAKWHTPKDLLLASTPCHRDMLSHALYNDVASPAVNRAQSGRSTWTSAFNSPRRRFLEGGAARRGAGLHACLVLRHPAAQRRAVRRHGGGGDADLAHPARHRRADPVEPDRAGDRQRASPRSTRWRPAASISASAPASPARRTMGLRAIKLAGWRRYIRVVQGLLAGETVEWGSEGGTHKIRFLNPEIELINTEDPIPLHVSAFGPRGAGADRQARRRLDGGRSATRRPPTARSPTCRRHGRRPGATSRTSTRPRWRRLRVCGGEPADSPRAKAQAGPRGGDRAFMPTRRPTSSARLFPVPPPLQARFDAYREVYRKYQPADARYLQNHRGHLMFLRPEEQEFITAPVIRGLTFTGTRAGADRAAAGDQGRRLSPVRLPRPQRSRDGDARGLGRGGGEGLECFPKVDSIGVIPGRGRGGDPASILPTK